MRNAANGPPRPSVQRAGVVKRGCSSAMPTPSPATAEKKTCRPGPATARTNHMNSRPSTSELASSSAPAAPYWTVSMSSKPRPTKMPTSRPSHGRFHGRGRASRIRAMPSDLPTSSGHAPASDASAASQPTAVAMVVIDSPATRMNVKDPSAPQASASSGHAPAGRHRTERDMAHQTTPMTAAEINVPNSSDSGVTRPNAKSVTALTAAPAAMIGTRTRKAQRIWEVRSIIGPRPFAHRRGSSRWRRRRPPRRRRRWRRDRGRLRRSRRPPPPRRARSPGA